MKEDPNPYVSIIIPCRNESAFIAGCLDSILTNGYPLDRLEIVVVDGMSDDGTRAILDRYAAQHACIRIIENPRKLTPNALNLGLAQARGSCVFRTDAHAGLCPGYIRTCVDALIRYDADAVGGVMKTVPAKETVVGRAIVAALSHPFGVGNSYFRIHATDPKWVDTLFCGCYRRDVFDRLQVAAGHPGVASQGPRAISGSGPFNVELARGQDMDFHLRLKRIGGKILLMPSISSFYMAHSDLRSFWRQSWNNGVWAILPFAYCDGMPVALRHLIPGGFVAAALGTLAAGSMWGASFWACGALLAAYGAVNLIASLHAAWRGRSLAMVFVLPLVFFTLHAAYGLGSLWGIVRLIGPRGIWRRTKPKGAINVPAAETLKAIRPLNQPDFMKRLFDCIAASCGLFLLSPVLVALAVLVKVGDGGPVLYRGRRVGLNGKPFLMVKFRTMVEQAERLGGPSAATADPRVTWVGRWLRKSKLDELPQLINVFKGDMSLVGPRPEVQQYVDLFTEEEKAILTVRPGLTDWATLWNIDEGSRLEGCPDPEKVYLETIRPVKLKLQLNYVRQHTFGTDVRIIRRTVAALFRRSRGDSAAVVAERGMTAR